MAKNQVAAAAAVASIAAGMVAVDIGGKQVAVPTDETMRKDGMTSLSSRIRHLSGLGVSTSVVSKIVKRENGEHPLYQHVRNVLNTPLKGAAAGLAAASKTSETPSKD